MTLRCRSPKQAPGPLSHQQYRVRLAACHALSRLVICGGTACVEQLGPVMSKRMCDCLGFYFFFSGSLNYDMRASPWLLMVFLKRLCIAFCFCCCCCCCSLSVALDRNSSVRLAAVETAACWLAGSEREVYDALALPAVLRGLSDPAEQTAAAAVREMDVLGAAVEEDYEDEIRQKLAGRKGEDAYVLFCCFFFFSQNG
jgi:hypothetical protein